MSSTVAHRPVVFVEGPISYESLFPPWHSLHEEVLYIHCIQDYSGHFLMKDFICDPITCNLMANDYTSKLSKTRIHK